MYLFNMSPFPSRSRFPLWEDITRQISQSRNRMVDFSSWKPKDDGSTKIDINISLSNSNIQNLTYDSFSAMLTPESVKEVQQLIETFVKDVAEVFGKESPGDTPKS